MRIRCSRRAIVAGATAAPMAMALASCQPDLGDLHRGGGSRASSASRAERGRLTFRPPSRPADRWGRTGRFQIHGSSEMEPAEMYVPADADGEPPRLVVMLHGAGGVARSALHILRAEADQHRLLLLAPKSTARTWDVLTGGYGPDVRNLDRLLREVAAAYPLGEYAIGGFSDGASYALSLGIANGDVFDAVIAFSPGFQAAREANGRPRFFVSHGTQDRVLPIGRCSRRIVPALEEAGYDVTYHEFDGGHAVPAAIQGEAVEWLGRGRTS